MAPNILVVDDSPAMRHVLLKTLKISGLCLGDCFEAQSGKEALEVLSRVSMDLVLADINMPVMNGEELVRTMAADPVLSAIPVIVVSTDGTETRIHRLQELGAKGYITKPFRPEEIRSMAERVLGVNGD